MSNPPSNPASGTSTPSRFHSVSAQPVTLEDVLKTQTVGLVHLSEFKKRRAELLEQKEREAAGGIVGPAGTTTAAGNGEKMESGVGVESVKKKRKITKKKVGGLSFGGDDEEDGGEGADSEASSKSKSKSKKTTSKSTASETTESSNTETKSPSEDAPSGSKSPTASADADSDSPAPTTIIKKRPNPRLTHPPPQALTKSTLLKASLERESLRREFLQLQEQIKASEIIIPFVFYDGTNVLPKDGGVTVKKGEAVWLFLERARRVSGRREWMRVSVDDLMLVRGELIIPHHYEFYYFIMNKTLGPHGPLFPYSTEPNTTGKPEVGTEDPALTKVVDRRWYERNKHIFPASIWTSFDPNENYVGRVRRDRENNSFFFS